MKTSNGLWAERLAGTTAESMVREIDIFDAEVSLRKQGKLEERVFAETRLRRGAYGQRYDNGQRHDGRGVKALVYPSGALTKGPSTMWDAPGMQRIKIPGGGVNAAQLETLAELAEEYSDGIAHITTRQDVQLHYVHIEDAPALMRRLAAVGITTREACGNSVRNVTACPYAGVCPDEAFDVTAYATALAWFLIGHPDCQTFGRKFKPAFSGCAQHACGLAKMHDLGLVAATREENGVTRRGFTMYVGGGLGAVPQQARLLDEFVPIEELFPVSVAIARVYAQHGEKKNRNRARLKFLIQDFGIEKFRELVRAERELLTPDPAWTDWIPAAEQFRETPLAERTHNIAATNAAPAGEAFELWRSTNLRPQRQSGYLVVTVALPLGDITADQLRSLADVTRRFTNDTVRTTVEQNLVLRWIPQSRLAELHAALAAADLAAPGAETIVDVTSCPGTDTCKLGISSSRGLAAELRQRLGAQNAVLDQAVRNLHIKISGCFNSCGQHHLADLGFYGVSRKMSGYAVPHFQVVLGGQWDNNAGSYGLPILAVPSKNIPAVVTRLTAAYVEGRQPEESFRTYVQRIGKAEVKRMLEDLTRPPAVPGDRDFFRDWNDPREYSLGDMGIGECAGEVISPVEFGLAAAERQAFEAQLALEQGNADTAWETAYSAMIGAARALVMLDLADTGQAPEAPGAIVGEFRLRLYDTQKFHDPYAGGKFAQYLFAAQNRAGAPHTADDARQLIEEAQLFIEASHSCYNRMGALVTA